MLCVVGGKGGVGKTTTAVGLARALAEADRSPLVVGADAGMPDLRRRLGVAATPSVDALADGLSPERAVHGVPAVPGLAALPAGAEVAAGLARLRWDGPVVVDCPPGAGDAVAAPLRVCDRAVVVSTAEPRSLAAAGKTVRLARRLDAPVAGAALRERGGTAPERVGGQPVLARIPEADTDLADPEPLSDPRVRAAYRRLARTLAARGPRDSHFCDGRNV